MNELQRSSTYMICKARIDDALDPAGFNIARRSRLHRFPSPSPTCFAVSCCACSTEGSRQCPQAGHLHRPSRHPPGQPARADAGGCRCPKPSGQYHQGLEHRPDAAGPRPSQWRHPTGAHRARRAHPHRRHQSAGVFRFPVESYADKILPSVVVQKARAGAS
jgi:hypothetical protein